ncbi:MAG TPA: geranylgeranyl reductase family protein [Anaerolineae bacterium]|nr:geranylgeranyl reductase family protein [Anaerolineae bacterium]
MSTAYDVIIAGAGPGGATAAYFLGEAGRRVLVLEKETLPRYKPCGGGLSVRMLEETFPFSFEPVLESRVKAVAYAFGDRTVRLPVPDQAVRTVMRDRFDAHILAHARAEVHQGVGVHAVNERDDRVVVETSDGGVFEGRYLIGADGANSVVARLMGLRRGKTLAAAIEAEVPAAPEVLRRFDDALLFILGEMRMGYLWIFPKADHLSVGIGALHPKPGALQAMLARVMARYGVPMQGARLHGHPIPIYLRREPIATAHTLLVGDAAGLVDPLSGEGIRLAIKSGKLAAEAILAGRPDRYPVTIHRQIGLCHTFGLGLAFLLYRFPRGCFTLGVRNPFATRAFVDMLSDRADYLDVIKRLFGTLPLFLLTEVVAGLAGRLGGPERRRRLRSAMYSGATIE